MTDFNKFNIDGMSFDGQKEVESKPISKLEGILDAAKSSGVFEKYSEACANDTELNGLVNQLTMAEGKLKDLKYSADQSPDLSNQIASYEKVVAGLLDKKTSRQQTILNNLIKEKNEHSLGNDLYTGGKVA